MTATDLELRRGDTYVRDLTVTAADGTAYDLTGATVWFTVKDRGDHAADDAAAVLKLSWVSGGASSGIAVATPDTGVLTVTLSAAQTAGLAVGAGYVYDVQVSKAGAIGTPVCGAITVLRDTTIRTTTP